MSWYKIGFKKESRFAPRVYLTAGRISCRKILASVELGLRENWSIEIISQGDSSPALDLHAHPLSLLRGIKLYHRQTMLANFSIANPVRRGTLPGRRQRQALLLLTRAVPCGCLFYASLWDKVN